MTAMVTVTYSPESNCFFSGTADGSIYRWEGNTCVKVHAKIHQGSVMGLAWANGKLLSSGSKDNKIKVSSAEG